MLIRPQIDVLRMGVAQEIMMGDVPAIGARHQEAGEIADPRPLNGHIAGKHILGRA